MTNEVLFARATVRFYEGSCLERSKGCPKELLETRGQLFGFKRGRWALPLGHWICGCFAGRIDRGCGCHR